MACTKRTSCTPQFLTASNNASLAVGNNKPTEHDITSQQLQWLQRSRFTPFRGCHSNFRHRYGNSPPSTTPTTESDGSATTKKCTMNMGRPTADSTSFSRPSASRHGNFTRSPYPRTTGFGTSDKIKRPEVSDGIFINFPHFAGMLGACQMSRLLVLRGLRPYQQIPSPLPLLAATVCALERPFGLAHYPPPTGWNDCRE